MPNFTNHILTTGGQALIAQAHLGRKLTFTKIAVGSGNVATPVNATALAAHQMDVGITSIQRDATNANWVRVRGMFTNVSLTTGFQFREMGLFARIDSEPEVLYSYVADAGAGDLIPAYDGANPVIVYPTMIVIIESTIPIHADITIGGDVDAENIGTSTVEGWFAQKVGNILEFKRPVEGSGIELIENASTITIGQRVLTIDLDLYVPLSYPAGTAQTRFATIPAALAYLSDVTIPPDRLATIHVAAGTFVNANDISVNHPQGDRINIKGTLGQIMVPTAASAAGDVVTLSGPVGTFSSVAAGDIIGVDLGTPNHNVMQASGVWSVTSRAANGSSLTYNTGTTNWTGAWTLGAAPIVKHLSTVISNFGIVVNGSGLGQLQDLALSACYVSIRRGSLRCDSVGIQGGIDTGFDARQAGYITLNNCWACNIQNGLVIDGAQGGQIINCFFNANSARGVWIQGAYVTANRVYAAGNAGPGVDLSTGSNFIFEGLSAVRNWIGFRASNGSTAAFSGGPVAFLENTSNDIDLFSLSGLQNAGATGFWYSTTNTPPNVLSANGCYFRP